MVTLAQTMEWNPSWGAAEHFDICSQNTLGGSLLFKSLREETMKRSMLLAISALVPGMFLMQSTGSSSVAIIDFERVVEESAGKDAINKLNAFAADQTNAIQKKTQDAQDIQNRLRVQDRALSTSARDQLTKDLADAQTQIEKLRNDAQQKFEQMQQQLLGPAQKKTMDAINNYAAEHSVKIVFDASALGSSLLYVHDTADITTEIIRKIAADLENPDRPQDAESKLAAQLKQRQWIRVPTFKLDIRNPEPTLGVESDRPAR